MHPTTIGEHIKKRRMDLGLLQRDVAKLLGVTDETITNWEREYGQPKIRYYPTIIAFLGFLPIQIDTSTLGGKIKLYRHYKGLSHKKMAKTFGVDETTIFNWERDAHVPQPKLLQSLISLFAELPVLP